MTLPAPRAELFGRTADIDLVARRVVETPGRLVTVTGCGGVGKTALALAAARKAFPDFTDGGGFADLSALRSADAVPAAVARALDVRLDSDPDPLRALASAVEGRNLLLVLDNCEHVLDGVVATADLLLDRAAQLRVLATSREPLYVVGEEAYPLAPLETPAADPAPGEPSAEDSPAVRMFLARAAAAGREIVWSPEVANDVADICRQLDGIPLALELAATNARTMALGELAARIRDEFALLIAHRRGGPERHQTMRAALEWSHDLLTDSEQTVFRRLGAFEGSWTAAAAEYVCADESLGDPVPELLAALVSKSLVVTDALESEARFRLLMPVREYARGRLAASGDANRTRERHAAYFVDLAERAGPEIHRADGVRWVKRLDADLDDVRLAVGTAQSRGDAETVFRIAGALWWYMWQRGHLREGVRWLEPVLDADAPLDARLDGMRAAAMWHGALGTVPDARALAVGFYDQARAQGGTTRLLAQAATILAVDLQRGGQMEQARPHLEEALHAARAVGDAMITGHALANLGESCVIVGDTDAAEPLFVEALAVFEAAGDRWGIGYALHHLASVRERTRRFAEAAELSARSVCLFDELGDRFYLVFALESLGRVVAEQGQGAAAAHLFGAASKMRTLNGTPLSPATRADHEASVTRIRESMKPADFERAWRAGTDLTTAEVVELAVAASSAPGAESHLAGPGGALTPREIEVAGLLTAGLTNREIAEELVIAVGTAGIHVEHILRKLDLQSRHQVAEWARERGLASG